MAHRNLAQSLKRASASTRRHYSTLALKKASPFPDFDPRLVELQASLRLKVTEVRGIINALDNPKIHRSSFVGAGIGIDSTLFVTSARLIGRVAADRGESGGYRAYIGSTAASVPDRKSPVVLTPLAVSFASDVAVLRVSDRCDPGFFLVRYAWLPACPVAASPPEKESVLTAVSYDEEDGWGLRVANVRSMGPPRKAKAPWPLDDKLAWLELDDHGATSASLKSKEKANGSFSRMSGTPWFNMYGELVGVASWVSRDDGACSSAGYAAALSSISSVVDYARAKGAKDPVVMDDWISSEVMGGEYREEWS